LCITNSYPVVGKSFDYIPSSLHLFLHSVDWEVSPSVNTRWSQS